MPKIDVKELEAPLTKFKDDIEKAVSEKLSASEGVVTDEIKILKEHNEEVKKQIDQIIKSIEERAKLQVPGLTDELEKKDFSFQKMAGSMLLEKCRKDVSKPWEAMGAEYEKGILDSYQGKSQIAGDGTQGGYIPVPQEVTDIFIDLVTPRTPIMSKFNPTIVTGLHGDLIIPKMTARGDAYWVGEIQKLTETQVALGQIKLSPKKLGAYTKFSRRLAYQTQGTAEALFRMQLGIAMGLKLNDGLTNGLGTDSQPLGIFQNPDIPWWVGRSATAATRFLIDNAASMQDQLDDADELIDGGQFGYLLHPKGLGGMRRERVPQYSAQPLGEAMPLTSDFVMMSKKKLQEELDYMIETSTQVKHDIVKTSPASTTSSNGIFGDWSQFIIGMWRNLEFRISEHASDGTGESAFLQDQFYLAAFQEVDCNVGRGTAFVKTDDIETLESKW